MELSQRKKDNPEQISTQTMNSTIMRDMCKYLKNTVEHILTHTHTHRYLQKEA